MGLLTPLYIAGLIGISLPIVFHLIRRTPRGQRAFSSLMFLTPSPPRLTRRSRLDNLLLLLLRAIALILIAFAFARPFLREAALLDFLGASGRRIAILIDTSASMQRAGLWQQAEQRMREVLSEADDRDRVALFAYDSTVRTLVDFRDVEKIVDGRQRKALIEKRFADLRPTWADSRLGDALATVADVLDATSEAEQDEVDASLQMFLISDMQVGSQIETLQGFQWPERVKLEILPVRVASKNNAAVSLIASDEAVSSGEWRARVFNNDDSQVENFWLYWATADSEKMQGERTSVYTPPGESRMVALPARPDSPAFDRVRLIGDDEDFDNLVFVADRRQQVITVLYLGSDDATDAQGMRYYFERAFPESASRRVDIKDQSADQPLAVDLSPSLIVVSSPINDDRLVELRRYVEGGGTILWIFRHASSAKAFADLANVDGLTAVESELSDYAMFGEIMFAHPLFAVFANPRYSDFTKIHFWKYRQLQFPGDAGLDIVARFDNGDPAIIERPFSAGGRIVAMTSGWNPDDSQLALSSKFVPMVHGILERTLPPAVEASYEIGQPLPIRSPEIDGPQDLPATVIRPDGTRDVLVSTETSYERTDQPGIYRLVRPDGDQLAFAVNLSTSESRTTPMGAEQLEHRGVQLGRQLTATEQIERNRQLRDIELEKRQKVWRWLILAAMITLMTETWLAGRLSKKVVFNK